MSQSNLYFVLIALSIHDKILKMEQKMQHLSLIFQLFGFSSISCVKILQMEPKCNIYHLFFGLLLLHVKIWQKGMGNSALNTDCSVFFCSKCQFLVPTVHFLDLKMEQMDPKRYGFAVVLDQYCLFICIFVPV